MKDDPISNRVVVLRHSLQGSTNDGEPTLTSLGVNVSVLMGSYVQSRLRPKYRSATSGPRKRGVESTKAFLLGASGIERRFERLITHVEPGLTDWGSDRRLVVEQGLKAAKAYMATRKCTVGEGLFCCQEAREALELKVEEALQVLRPKLEEPGDHLISGIHEATIDGMMLAAKVLPLTHEQIMLHGGYIERAEGFFIDNTVGTRVEVIRLPPHIRALINTVGEFC